MNKYLEKAAGIRSVLTSSEAKHALGWGAGFGAVGAYGQHTENKDLEKKFNQGRISRQVFDKRHKSVLGSAAKVGAIGAIYGGASRHAQVKSEEFIKKQRQTEENFRKWQQGFGDSWEQGFNHRSGAHGSRGSGSSSGREHDFGGWGRNSSDLSSIYSDLGAPKGGFKTKAEATRHYRKMAAKHHPDRGGKVEDMQKLNAAWDKFKKHGGGFDKLASWNCNDLLEKVARYNWPGDMADIHRELAKHGVDATKFKSKKHYNEVMCQTMDKYTELEQHRDWCDASDAFDRYDAHPDGYRKLA